MATFDELALQGEYPVLHSLRSDHATLIATRVPLTDIGMGRWGWVLTLNHRNGRTDSDDIAALRDNTGQQYPKVYSLSDMQNYIEKWGCAEWEEGYHQNGHQLSLPKNTTSSDAAIVREDVLKQLLSELKEHQEAQARLLVDELHARLEETRNKLEMENATSFQALNDNTIEAYNRLLDRSRTNNETLDQQVVTQIVKVTEVVEAQSLLTREEAGRHVETMTEEIRNRVSLTQKSTLDAIEAQFNLAKVDTTKHLEEEHEEIKTRLTGFSTELKELQEQIKLALQALDPDVDEDLDKTQNADPAFTATKMVRKATTQIERITQSHQKMSMNYFNSANEQSRKAFKYAWFLGFTAVGLLAFFIVATVFMALLHLYGFAVVLGSIGGIGTTIVTVMGLISSSHAKTAEQFAYAQKLLDRRYGSTIANALIIGYTDEDRKQASIDKIVDSLLKNEATEKT
jgi:uncharacterized membrane protein YphA (DoxX/SURF4 family)